MSSRAGWLIALCFAIGLAVPLLWRGVPAVVKDDGPKNAPAAVGLPGMQVDAPPWEADSDHLSQRLRSIGLPALAAEGRAVHLHEHLSLFVHGARLTVASRIGIGRNTAFFAPIHTHGADGIIHVESPPVQRPYTLGAFFDVWGVRLSADCLGGYCQGEDGRLHVYVNGAPVRGDPRAVVLRWRQEIVVGFGRPSELPRRVPASYRFPPGY